MKDTVFSAHDTCYVGNGGYLNWICKTLGKIKAWGKPILYQTRGGGKKDDVEVSIPIAARLHIIAIKHVDR